MGAAREAVAGPATIQVNSRNLGDGGKISGSLSHLLHVSLQVASYVFAGKDGQGLDLSLIGKCSSRQCLLPLRSP
jgi:hypothetical protein